MVQGLTTFVSKRSRIYMEKFELHDTKVIIDGDSIAYELYASHFIPNNPCFNGDYDRYAQLVRHFFNTLSECNITPYILFDGGYEDRRMSTILNRMMDRINTAAIVNPTSDNLLFPLCLGETFKDIALELNIKVVVCDYECDMEVANVANKLNSPVLSFDSDFYIFDVIYIPFNTVSLRPITTLRTINNEKLVYKYLACEVFKRDTFLKDMGLEIHKLPLFAVLLGNDYIQRSVFKDLFHKFGQNPIGKLALFLADKTTEAALKDVLAICNYEEEEKVIGTLNSSIDGYILNNKSNKYLKYFRLVNIPLDTNKLIESIDEDELTHYIERTGHSPEMISLFFYKFRCCRYPSFFMTILLYNTYHVRPQIEDHTLKSAHLVSIDIIGAIHKILKPHADQLQFYTRIHMTHEEHLVPFCTTSIPSFIDLQNMDTKSCQQILCNILYIEVSFMENCLNHFPDSWKLFIIAINYLCCKSDITWTLIKSFLLCKIVITYIDRKLKKIIRSPKLLTDCYKDDIFQILTNKRVDANLKSTIPEAIEDITFDDSLLALKNVIHYFRAKPELVQNVDLFNRRLVHSIAEFQSCLYHINSLNSLLNFPFESCKMWNSFDGTFIYNVVSDLNQPSNEQYIRDVLEDSPTVLNCFNLMIDSLTKEISLNF